MSAPATVWLAVGPITLVALIAVLAGLARQVALLARTLGRFQREIQPLAEQIVAEADRAASRAGRIHDGLPFGRS